MIKPGTIFLNLAGNKDDKVYFEFIKENSGFYIGKVIYATEKISSIYGVGQIVTCFYPSISKILTEEETNNLYKILVFK